MFSHKGNKTTILLTFCPELHLDQFLQKLLLMLLTKLSNYKSCIKEGSDQNIFSLYIGSEEKNIKKSYLYNQGFQYIITNHFAGFSTTTFKILNPIMNKEELQCQLELKCITAEVDLIYFLKQKHYFRAQVNNE